MAQRKDGQKKKEEEKRLEKTGKLQKRGIQKRGVKEDKEIVFIPDSNFDIDISDA